MRKITMVGLTKIINKILEMAKKVYGDERREVV
jgi:hypothetical protein